MKDKEPTIRSRELGEGLRIAMVNAGFTASSIARELGWSASRVSRLLSGKRGGSSVEVAAFLAVCGVKGAEWHRLMALTRDRDRVSWFQQHGPVLPKQVRTLVDHEQKAIAVDEFRATVVPELLQTRSYARWVLSASPNLPRAEVEERVSARVARQGLVDRPGAPRFTFFIHEFVLLTPIAGKAVMSEQLHSLLQNSVRPNVVLRVVPSTVGVHAAMAGNFTLLDIRDFRPIVYLDNETSCVFLENPVEVASYRNIVSALHTTALDEARSRELIAKLATERYSD